MKLLRRSLSAALLGCVALLSVSTTTNALPPENAATDPFWQDQIQQLINRTSVQGGATAGEMQNLYRTGILPALSRNPYTQIVVLSLNGMHTQITYNPSLPASENIFSMARNRLVFGGTTQHFDQVEVFFHEGTHGVQRFFAHPSAVPIASVINDPIHTFFAETHACLPLRQGNVSQAMICAIDHGYDEGVTILRAIEPGLNDVQLFGIANHLSANCPGPIIVGPGFEMSTCAQQQMPRALEIVQDADFAMDGAKLVLPGGRTAANIARLKSIVRVVATSRLVRFGLPVVGIGASLFMAERAYAEGDYIRCGVEIAGCVPVIGIGIAAGDYIVKPIAEHLGIIDGLADILVPLFYDGPNPYEDPRKPSDPTLYDRITDTVSGWLLPLFLDPKDAPIKPNGADLPLDPVRSEDDMWSRVKAAHGAVTDTVAGWLVPFFE